MKIVGTSVNKKDLLITSSDIRQNSGYLTIVDWRGKIKYQQHFTNSGVKNLKNFTLNDNNYYSYQLDNGNKSKLDHIYTGNWPSRLIITDSKFNVIKDNIKLLPFGSIKQSTGCDYHDYKIIDILIITKGLELPTEYDIYFVGNLFLKYIIKTIIVAI